MNNDYELIALDMDDTLLRSDKTISDETIASFKKVRDAGKYVVICTGRPVSEIAPYDEQFSEMQTTTFQCLKQPVSRSLSQTQMTTRRQRRT